MTTPGSTVDGNSWRTAYTDIQTAVDNASSGDMVWAAIGTYTSSGNTAVLDMKQGVHVFGGFVGTEEYLDQRLDPKIQKTYLDGQGGAYHVVDGASHARLDGFYIKNGDADGSGDDSKGGGMFNDGVKDLVIDKCTFEYNIAEADGGAIYNDGGEDIQIRYSNFNGNSVDGSGGAICNNDAVDVSISDCNFPRFGKFFKPNVAYLDGGAIYNLDSVVSISNGLFAANKSTKDDIWTGSRGGAIANNGSTVEIYDTVFQKNTSVMGGGAIFNTLSSSLIENSVFYDSSGYWGGAIYNGTYSYCYIYNCTFYDNSAGNNTYGAAVYSWYYSGAYQIISWARKRGRYSG